MTIVDVYRPSVATFEYRPFLDRVLTLVRLFEERPTLRLRLSGTIAAGHPIEALEEPDEVVELESPEVSAQHHPLLADLRALLCSALQSLTGDAFEIARVVTPLLVGLRLAGKVPLDLDPWLYAGITLIIARTGIASFCSGGPAKKAPSSRVSTSLPTTSEVAPHHNHTSHDPAH